MGGTPSSTEAGKSTALVHGEEDMPDVATWARWPDQPLAFYRCLHEEHGPLWFDGACWYVTDEAMIGRIVTDEEYFSAHPPAPTSPSSPLMHLVLQQALFYDGEEHRRVSRLMCVALASLLGLGGSLLTHLHQLLYKPIVLAALVVHENERGLDQERGTNVLASAVADIFQRPFTGHQCSLVKGRR